MDPDKDVLDERLVPIEEIPTATIIATEDTILMEDLEETGQVKE